MFNTVFHRCGGSSSIGKGALSSSSHSNHPDSIRFTRLSGVASATQRISGPRVPRIFFLSQICITPFRARYRYRPKPKVPGEYRDLPGNYLARKSNCNPPLSSTYVLHVVPDCENLTGRCSREFRGSDWLIDVDINGAQLLSLRLPNDVGQTLTNSPTPEAGLKINIQIS